MFTTRIALSLAAVTLFVSGCTKEDEMGEEEFCTEYARTECATVGTWCASATPDACNSTRAAACQQRAAAWKSASRPFNPKNAQICIDKVKAVYATTPISAENLRALDDTCARVYQGVVARNAACTVSPDCAEGMICDKGLCGPRVVVAVGGGCANVGEVCPTGQTCKASGALRLCQARAAAGMACSAEEPCLESLRCGAGGTCEARLPLSSACTSDGDCVLPTGGPGYCDPYVNLCTTGLAFAPTSKSCEAFTGAVSAAL